MELIFLLSLSPSLPIPISGFAAVRRRATSSKQMKPAGTAKANEWNQRTRCGRASERIAIKTIKLHLLSVYSIIFCDRFAIRNFIFISLDAFCSAASARAARSAQHFLSCLVVGREVASQRNATRKEAKNKWQTDSDKMAEINKTNCKYVDNVR